MSKGNVTQFDLNLLHDLLLDLKVAIDTRPRREAIALVDRLIDELKPLGYSPIRRWWLVDGTPVRAEQRPEGAQGPFTRGSFPHQRK